LCDAIEMVSARQRGTQRSEGGGAARIR